MGMWIEETSCHGVEHGGEIGHMTGKIKAAGGKKVRAPAGGPWVQQPSQPVGVKGAVKKGGPQM